MTAVVHFIYKCHFSLKSQAASAVCVDTASEFSSCCQRTGVALSSLLSCRLTLTFDPQLRLCPCRLLQWVRRALRSAGRSRRQECLGLRLPGQDREARVPERFVQPPLAVVVALISSSFPHLVCSPSDYTKGFGGKFGVETDKVDKSAVGFEYQGKTEKHESQKGRYQEFFSVDSHPHVCPDSGVLERPG